MSFRHQLLPAFLLTAWLGFALGCGGGTQSDFNVGAEDARQGEADDPILAAKLKELNAYVRRDEQVPGKPIVAVEVLNGILDKRKMTNADLKELASLKHLRSLSLSDTDITDAGLKQLVAFPELEHLSLHGCKRITDAGLKELAALKHFKNLSLRATKISDAGIGDLASLPKLEELTLSSTQVTDAGLRSLATFEALKKLSLDGTQVADAGMKEVAKIKNLNSLNLWGTKVGDAGMRDLSECKALQELILDRTPVTNTGLKEIAKIKGLRILRLAETKITDAGMKELASLQELNKLSVFQTPITDAGVKDLVTLEHLEELDLQRTKVTDAAVGDLIKLRRLRVLDTGGTLITKGGQVALRTGLAECEFPLYFGPPPNRAKDPKAPLNTDEEKAVRDAVYKGKRAIGGPLELGVTGALGIPTALTELYENHPQAVLDLLLKIMEGGNPRDSSLAAGYALSLLNGPAVGSICITNFDKDTYDTLDKNWEATPREHWIRVIKRDRAEVDQKKN